MKSVTARGKGKRYVELSEYKRVEAQCRAKSKLLKKIERDLARGSTFVYHPENVKSLSRGMDKVCEAASKVIGEIRRHFTVDGKVQS